MTRKDWIILLSKLSTSTHPLRTAEEKTAFIEAAIYVAATCYAKKERVGISSFEEIGYAAYIAMQDKADEIKTRN